VREPELGFVTPPFSDPCPVPERDWIFSHLPQDSFFLCKESVNSVG
jgi:hypothetical protein